jgi:hypothetical protein
VKHVENVLCFVETKYPIRAVVLQVGDELKELWTSVITSKLAIEGHLKTGHRAAARTSVVFTASGVGAAMIPGTTNGRPWLPPFLLV